MNDKISVFHKVMLWFTLITSLIFGVGQYLFTEGFLGLLKVNNPDLAAVSCIGGFLIASVVASGFSLKSGLWSQVRIATYFLMTWSLLNGIHLLLFIVQKNDTSLVPNTINCFLIGIGMAIVVCKRNFLSKR